MTKKRTSHLKRLLALSLSALLALSMIVTAFATGVTTTIPSSLSPSNSKTSLKVSYNGDDKTDIKVQAFRVLQKVYKDGTQTDGDPDNTTANNDNSLYVVTAPFAQFFNTAYNTYMSSDDYKNADTLYLVYDAMNNHHYLNLQTNNHVDGNASKDVLAQDKYITISQTNAASDATTSKLDTDPLYFAASLIAKIAGDSTTGATGTASDIAKLSDWLSVYVYHAQTGSTTVDFSGVKAGEGKFTSSTSDTSVGTVTFSDVPYGYYVVLASRGASSGTNASNTPHTYISHSILNVAGATNITLKADVISLDKKIITVGGVDVASGTNNATANVGQTLTYRVTSKTPDYTSYDLDNDTRYNFDDTVLNDSKQVKTDGVASDNYGKYRYVFRDTMTNQSFVATGVKIQIASVDDSEITYDDSMFKLTKKNGNTSTIYDLARLELTDYVRSVPTGLSVEQGKQTMYLVFNMKTIKTLKLDTKDITLTYQTVLEKEAMTNKNTNEIALIYSNDPYNMANKENWLPPSTVTKIHTYGLDVTKVFADGDTTNETYEQVTFKLCEGDSASGNALWFIRDKQTGEYMLCCGQNDYSDDDKQDKPTQELKLILSTTGDAYDGTNTKNPNAGKLLIQGLGKKTYTLVETAAPGGYPSGKTATITYSAKDGDAKALKAIGTDGSSVAGDNVMSGSATLVNEVETGNYYSIAFHFLNKKGFKLPTTGDTGTIVFAVAGVVLACAGVLMLKKDKKKQ